VGRIFDAVYGYIELNEVEFRLVNSPIFQRLHGIKQLGPLHIVFPSAQHSRFSHSVGVYHIVKKMIGYLENRTRHGHKFQDDEKSILKYAALLHDIGHVPLSHVGEIVLSETYVPEDIDSANIEPFDKRSSWRSLFFKEYTGSLSQLHECISADMVLHNKEIGEILSKEQIWEDKNDLQKARKQIAQIIVGNPENEIFRALLHSELDADRLDYLLRDSFFTGVGYGKIDLDYIISRMVVIKDEDNIDKLCFEAKGLHTIEHYILGRFFLQTQVIYNRKVTFLDLLFADVMKYMIRSGSEKNWHIMGLVEFLEKIRPCSDTEIRGNLHRVYEYTDAQVFTKMRALHDELDNGLRGKQRTINHSLPENPRDCYINDCIKIIMDGQVPEPVVSRQKLVDRGSADGKEYINEFEQEAERVKKEIVRNSDIDSLRIKIKTKCKRVMQYTKGISIDGKIDEEANREAVKIFQKNPDGVDYSQFAGESNASILGGLIDKGLLIFNVYYVQAKEERDEEVAKHEENIKNGYKNFITKHF